MARLDSFEQIDGEVINSKYIVKLICILTELI